MTDGSTKPMFERRWPPELIGRLVAAIEKFEADWTQWFAVHGIVPHEVVYEELAADPLRTAHDALDHLGLHVPPGLQLVTGHRRQADQVNADWSARFRAAHDEDSGSASP